jgi:hypothetical protein
MSGGDRGYCVEINQLEQFGDAIYSKNGVEAKLGWEFGGSGLVVMDIPTESVWTDAFPFPVTRRREIAERIAREIIPQKAKGSRFHWAGNAIQVSE